MRRRAETTSRLPRLVVEFENGAPRVHDLVPPQVADVATIYVGPPQPTTLDAASRLARLRPESTVLVPDDRVVGVARVAAHGRLYRYGLSLTPHDGTLPPGGWDRMARLQHEVYRHRSLSRGQSSRPTQMPWNELDEAVRESNAEQIRTVMRAVRDLGYEWVSTSDGDDSGLPNEHRGDVAEQMHEAWVQAKRAAGYVYGEPSNPAADPPTNSYLVPWADLSEEKQRENEQQVEAAVSRVTVFGLTPKQPAQRSGHGPHPPLSQEAGQPQQ